MVKKRKVVSAREAGFTLIEIVMVLVLLGILAAVAVPKYLDLEEEAQYQAARAAVAEAQARVNARFSEELLIGKDCSSALSSASDLSALSDSGTEARYGDFILSPKILELGQSGASIDARHVASERDFQQVGRIELPICEIIMPSAKTWQDTIPFSMTLFSQFPLTQVAALGVGEQLTSHSVAGQEVTTIINEGVFAKEDQYVRSPWAFTKKENGTSELLMVDAQNGSVGVLSIHKPGEEVVQKAVRVFFEDGKYSYTEL